MVTTNTVRKRAKTKGKSKVFEVVPGTAAEYFVAAELLRRGVNAFLSIGAYKQIDVLVRARTTITSVDVKAVHGRKSQVSWNMPKVVARGSTPNFFYVLVWLGTKHGDFATPEYFILPARWAAKKCEQDFAKYVAGSATRSATSDMRRLRYSDVGEWRNRWDLLGAA